MRGLLIGVVVVAVLAILAFFLVSMNNDDSSEKMSSDQSTNQSTTDNSDQSGTDNTSFNEASSAVTVSYTGSEFSPSSTTLKSGGSLTWTNSSNEEVQIGVNPHPSHTGDKAITGGEFVVALGPGESKTIVVSTAGTFGYHNHLNSDDRGTIIVQ